MAWNATLLSKPNLLCKKKFNKSNVNLKTRLDYSKTLSKYAFIKLDVSVKTRLEFNPAHKFKSR